jgi:hypothetical protein
MADAIGKVYFAAVDPGEVYSPLIHSVEDEVVLALKINQAEGEFARAEIEIENPGQGLLNPLRKKRCFISIENPDIGTPKLIFAGRILGYPSDTTQTTVTLQYIGQPENWESDQDTLLQLSKVAPFYNDLFVSADRRNDPAEILAGRTALLYWDRITNTVALSDIVESGTLFDLGEKPFFDSVSFDIGDPPITSVNLNIETQWIQTAVGTVDAGEAIRAQFSSPVGAQVNTLTPYSFEDAYNGVSLPTGYTEREKVIAPTANDFGLAQSDLKSADVLVNATDFPFASGGTAGQRVLSVPRVYYNTKLILDAVYQQKRRETANIVLNAVTQDFALKSNQVKDVFVRIQNPTEAEQGSILDDAAPSFFYDTVLGDLTTFGRECIEHGIARARAIVTKANRIIETTFQVDLREVIDLTVNDTVRFTDSRFPGGSIRGKVISYAFSISQGGGYGAEITLASMIGTGVDSVGTGAGGEQSLLQTVYNNEFGAATMTSEVFYNVVTPTIDQPVDTAQMQTDDQYLILNTTVNNQGGSQASGFSATSLPGGSGRPDTYLQNNPTGVEMDLRTLNPDKEIATTITIDVEDYTLPKSTDLEA